jgi:hypothetical protein
VAVHVWMGQYACVVDPMILSLPTVACAVSPRVQYIQEGTRRNDTARACVTHLIYETK